MKRLVLLSTALLLVGGAFGNYLRYVEQKPDRWPSFEVIPYEAGGYFGEEHRLAEYNYEVLRADTTTLRLYRDPDGSPVWLLIAYFSSQKYGSQIHSPKHCLPGGGWKIEKLEQFRLPLPGGYKTVNRLVIKTDDRSQAMFYWYETRGGSLTNEFALKWDLAKNSLLLRSTDVAFIRLTLPIEQGNIEVSSKRAADFLKAFYPGMTQGLPFGN
ncbi:MAG: EpsI family protein [candidate division Zixibacteria bacterium]|nr:EpsI family protein [candidate division Zixibacteria bacterium]MCK4606834.1 EpsI family protein [candidate division Zixibacteria bacterium]